MSYYPAVRLIVLVFAIFISSGLEVFGEPLTSEEQLYISAIVAKENGELLQAREILNNILYRVSKDLQSLILEKRGIIPRRS